jgi:ABC-type sulfate transport system substrate-binding protein
MMRLTRLVSLISVLVIGVGSTPIAPAPRERTLLNVSYDPTRDWLEVQKVHFSDGGVFDQIYRANR